MRVGPVEIEDFSVEHWRISFVVGKAHYLTQWYSKHFHRKKTFYGLTRLYLKDIMKNGHRYINALEANIPYLRWQELIKDTELALVFLKVKEDEESEHQCPTNRKGV